MISHKINSTSGFFFLLLLRTASMKCENDESLGEMSGFGVRWLLKKTNLKNKKKKQCEGERSEVILK